MNLLRGMWKRVKAAPRRIAAFIRAGSEESAEDRSTAGRRRRALFVLVGVAGLAAALFIAFQSWSVLNRMRSMPLGDVLVAAPDRDGTAGREPTVEVARAESVAVKPPEPAGPAAPGEDRPPTPRTGWTAPVTYSELVGPGWRRDAQGAFWYFESAAVMRAPAGSSVVAAAPGVVASAIPAAAGGWDVEVVHDNGYVTSYGNVFQLAVAPGDRVSAHSLVGTVMAPSDKDAASPDEAGPAITFAAWDGGLSVDVADLLASAE